MEGTSGGKNPELEAKAAIAQATIQALGAFELMCHRLISLANYIERKLDEESKSGG